MWSESSSKKEMAEDVDGREGAMDRQRIECVMLSRACAKALWSV